MESKVNRNLIVLSFMVILLLGALFCGEWMFPMDGQFFQVIAVAFGSVITLWGQSVKSVFHIPDSPGVPPPGTTSQVTETKQTIVQEPAKTA